MIIFNLKTILQFIIKYTTSNLRRMYGMWDNYTVNYGLFLPAFIAFSKYSTASRVSRGVPSPAMYIVPYIIEYVW